MRMMLIAVALVTSIASTHAFADDATDRRKAIEEEYAEQVVNAYISSCQSGTDPRKASADAQRIFKGHLTEIARNSKPAAETTARVTDSALGSLYSECAKMRLP